MAEQQVAEAPNIASEAEPALIVNFGTSTNRRRPLAPTTTLVGRSRTCDVRLEAPEVGNLHCVLTRANGAIVLRDCESMAGTQVNGKPVKEAALHDGDSIQVGPFSFTISIPASESSMSLERSSIELDEMRARCEELTRECESLRHLPPFPTNEGSDAESVDQIREHLRRAEERSRELEARLAASQKSLEDERQRIKALTQEAAAQFRTSQEERRALLAEIEGYKQSVGPVEEYPGELNQLRKEAESLRAQVIELRDKRPLSQPLFTPPADLLEYEKHLLEFRDQLEMWAMAVESQLEPLKAELAAVKDRYEQAAAECERLRSMPSGPTSALLSDPRARSADVEDLEARYYKAQQEIMQLHERLDREHAESESRLAVLQRDLEQERQRIKEMVKEAAGQFKAARSESEVLKKQLEQSRSSSVPLEQFPGELEVLRDEVRTLRAQISSAPVGSESSADLAAYEQQLNEFRSQLDAAHAQQEQRQLDLEERLRSAEVQLSRERAEIAREKSILERMRSEVKTELMHAEREAKNYERMAPFHKLANEVRQVRPGEGDAGVSLSDRIRGFLKRFGDG